MKIFGLSNAVSLRMNIVYMYKILICRKKCSAVCSLRFHPTGPRRGLGRRTKTVVVKTKYLFSYTQCAYNLGHRLSTSSQELTQ